VDAPQPAALNGGVAAPSATWASTRLSNQPASRQLSCPSRPPAATHQPNRSGELSGHGPGPPRGRCVGLAAPFTALVEHGAEPQGSAGGVSGYAAATGVGASRGSGPAAGGLIKTLLQRRADGALLWGAIGLRGGLVGGWLTLQAGLLTMLSNAPARLA
jgi:hypothetical protein